MMEQISRGKLRFPYEDPAVPFRIRSGELPPPVDYLLPCLGRAIVGLFLVLGILEELICPGLRLLRYTSHLLTLNILERNHVKTTSYRR